MKLVIGIKRGIKIIKFSCIFFMFKGIFLFVVVYVESCCFLKGRFVYVIFVI